MGVAPTVYRWDDTGVPGRPAGNTSSDRISYLGSVLRACLVSGYGSKAGAGWEELAYQAPSGSDGYLVLRNGAQTGVARINLHVGNYSFDLSEVGGGWDGSDLLNDAGYAIRTVELVADVQTLRWVVIANDATAILLLWRPPDGLTGTDLSAYNMPALILGAMLPWGSAIDPRAAPNFALYAPIYGDQQHNSELYSERRGFVSGISREGGQVTSQVDSDYYACPSQIESGAAAGYWEPLAEHPVVPASVRDASSFFARLPGWYCAIGRVSESALINVRDSDGLWTGDPLTVNGKSALLVANQYRYGYISLEAADWP